MAKQQENQLQELQKYYQQFGQDHVFRFWDSLSPEQKDKFAQQLRSIDLALIDNLYNDLIYNAQSTEEQENNLTPADVISIPKTKEEIERKQQAFKTGEAYLRSGKVGTILVAGGQGTRLGFEGPKGKFPITPVREKSLFQFHAEKILALSKRYQTTIPWYIMTSEVNDAETRQFFADNNYFGCRPSDVFFFQQQMIPGVDPNGKLFLEREDRVFTNPNGHGGTLQALRDSGALEDMIQRGIEELFYFQVDNVLIRICDPVFIGYHLDENAEMSCKVVSKRDPLEKVGVVGYQDGKLTVIEYSDLSEEEMRARNADGSLKFNAGSIAIHLLRRKFIEELTNGNLNLPYHLANKKIPFIDENGNTISPTKPNGYKFEMFIFDALQYTNNAAIMEVEREKEFSPVKNADGKDSPQTAKQSLCNIYGSWLEAAGVSVPREGQNGDVKGRLEISPLFAIDQEEFVRKAPGNLSFQDGLYLE